MSHDTDKQRPKAPEMTASTHLGPAADQARPAALPAAKPKTKAIVWDARLKAALKANMARRKGQARARADSDTDLPDIEKNE